LIESGLSCASAKPKPDASSYRSLRVTQRSDWSSNSSSVARQA
jgi:hypothetical protein